MRRPRRLTNDGNAILREIEVAHPAAKSMIELSRTQDEEVGDGTTSVIILGAFVRATAAAVMALRQVIAKITDSSIPSHSLAQPERSSRRRCRTSSATSTRSSSSRRSSALSKKRSSSSNPSRSPSTRRTNSRCSR